MIKISFHSEELKTGTLDGQDKIFDPVRKKWLVLSPEEWVRQNILHYLLNTKMYPAGLIAIEKEIMLGELKKRCDLVVYSREMQPWMIIECKEMTVTLDHKAIDQVLRYNISLPSEFLIITNGSYCYGFKKERNLFREINEFPEYPL